MKKSLKLIVLLSIIVMQSCSSDVNSFEESDQKTANINTININNINYSIIQFNQGDDLCEQISNLDDNTYFVFDSDTIETIECNITLEHKSNIIINGNNSTLKYIDLNGNGYKILVNYCNNIKFSNLNIDNNNTKANYINDTLMSSGRVQIFNSNKIELDNMNFNKQEIVGNVNGTVHQIYIKESRNSIIKNCIIDSTDGELIMLKASEDCLIKGNYLNEGWSGVATAGFNDSGIEKLGHRNSIIGNTVVNSSTAFITINDRDAIINSNYIYNNDEMKLHGPGIRFGHNEPYLYASNATCKNNIIKDLKYPNGAYNAVGIKVDYTQSDESNKKFTDLIIEGNTIKNCYGGIKISNQSGQYMSIENNEISILNGYSIDVFSSDSPNQQEPQHCYILKNKLSSNNEVVNVYNSSIKLFDNKIYSNPPSIHNKAINIKNLHNTDSFKTEIEITYNNIMLNNNNGIYYNGLNLENALIQNNVITKGNLGIYLGGKNNQIKYNTIKSCNSRSIYIRYASDGTTITNNYIYNDFETSIYLHSTKNTTIKNNNLTFTGDSPYAWAIWKNNPISNTNCTISNNTLNNFIYETNN